MVDKILDMKIDVLICTGTVSKLVIDKLVEKKIIVLSRIQMKEIKFLGQMFKIPLLPSIDLISNFETKSLIGKCKEFKFENKGKNSYCLFVGEKTQSGCTIKLYGKNENQLNF